MAGLLLVDCRSESFGIIRAANVRQARRDEGGYREDLTEEQRRLADVPAGGW